MFRTASEVLIGSLHLHHSDVNLRAFAIAFSGQSLNSSYNCSVHQAVMRNGAPGGNRTPDPLLRRQTLYPTELRARSVKSQRLLVYRQFTILAGQNRVRKDRTHKSPAGAETGTPRDCGIDLRHQLAFLPAFFLRAFFSFAVNASSTIFMAAFDLSETG